MHSTLHSHMSDQCKDVVDVRLPGFSLTGLSDDPGQYENLITNCVINRSMSILS